MAGIKFKVNDTQLQKRIENMKNAVADASPLMKIWGEIALTSISENFEHGGRPAWPPLSKETIRRKGHARLLIGRTGNLQRVVGRAERDRVVIGSSPAAKDYAAIQQFGGKAGRGRKVTIPARPYIKLQDEDLEEMRETARAYIKRSSKA